MRQTLVSWTATSCFLILAVIVLRSAFGKRMGAGLRYALWGLVLVRLLVPVQLFTSPVVGTVIDSERVVIRQTQTGRDALDARPVDSAQAGLGLEGLVPYVPNPPAMPDPPPVPDAPDWREIPAALGWMWLGGAIVMALVLLGCNLNFYLRLRRTRRPIGDAGVWAAEGGGPHMSQQMPFEVGAPPLGGPACNIPAGIPHNGDCLPVYTAQGLPSPCLFGVFRPAIYVAQETAADPAALRHVLAHEGTHYRHGDHIWSLLRCAALCIHWWNPLVWLAAKLSRRDGELACDEGALKRLGDGERTAYGSTLLTLVAGEPAPGGPLICSTSMTGDKKSLKERFARIARTPRRAVGIAAAAVVLAALVTVCAFGQKTNPPASWEELEADLSLTVEDGGTVCITGTVDGMALPTGTTWWADRETLTLPYPHFDSGIVGFLDAKWTDESHTAVNLSTLMMQLLSSYFPSGRWEFIVDFSEVGTKVTKMEAVTGTVPEGMEVQMYPKTISDEEAIRAGRIAARLLTAAEEYYRDWEEKGNVPVAPEETAQPPAPSEDPASVPASARAELRAALLGATDFALYRENGMDYTPYTVDIHTAPPRAFVSLSEEWEKYNSIAVVDLDGDGVEEVVYHVTDVAEDAGGYLIFHWAGPGDIRCYPSYWRTFWDLKTDGTYSYDFYTGRSGAARVSFPSPGYTMQQRSILEAYYPDIEPDAGGGSFTVNGKIAAQEAYDAAVEAQNAKPDAVWYEFTPENVEKVLR